MAHEGSDRPAPRRGVGPRVIAAACSAFVVAMLGMAYAAVPLYSMICAATGFGGATRVGTAAPGTVLERTITVRFDANVAPGLPWSFAPEQREMTVKVGETAMAYFRVTSHAAGETHANATYNVTPGQSGAYFVKLQCFCFDEQSLGGRQTADLPVVFYIDPAIADDPEMASVKTMTLSYTFFPVKTDKATTPVARAGQAEGARESAKQM